MRTTIVGMLAASLLVLGPTAPARAQVAAKEVTAKQVNDAIADGIGFLQRQQKVNGTWDNYPGFDGGTTALCTLSLLTAGVPATDPGIQKALAHLRRLDPKRNYVIALQTMVFCAAEPQRDIQLIVRNVKTLEGNQRRGGPDDGDGGWDYSKGESRVDNSNSQFVALALYEAERVGVKTDPAVWRKARTYWERTQAPEGCWGYWPDTQGTGSMTCAGLAVLLMAREILNEGDAKVAGEEVECCAARDDESQITRALQWLSTPQLRVQQNPGDNQHVLYYLYGLERVGRLTNQRLIGKDDWYRIGAAHLVGGQVQLGAGQWVGVGTGERDPMIATCFALMFLAKGRRPVLAAKLAHGNTDDWEHHRKDLANLTRYCEKKWGFEMTWQVMQMKNATLDDLNQVKVLYLSGDEPPDFTPAEIAVLRRYLDFGGFLLAENCCREKKPEFDAGFRKLVEQLFPESDDGRLRHPLKILQLDHPVYNAEEPLIQAKDAPLLYGVDVGCRTSVVYSDAPLGCYWELDRMGRATKYPDSVEAVIRLKRSLGINIMAYATNREVKYKLDTPPIVAVDDKLTAAERAMLYVAELRQSGSSIAPNALQNLLRQLKGVAGLRVSTEKRELALTQDDLFDYHLVFLHGRTGFTFSPAERKQLRAFVERGGMIFGDAVCSSEEFAASFRREMAAVFPDAPLKPIPVNHAMFTNKFGGEDLSQVVLRDPRRGNVGADEIKATPELEGLQFGSRYGAIFSKYDLSCALERQNSLECAGYKSEDAARIGINIILFSLRGNL